MLKLFSYISSKCIKAINKSRHESLYHKIDSEATLKLAQWHCQRVLLLNEDFDMHERAELISVNIAPSAGALLAAIEEVHEAVVAKDYVKSIPEWNGESPTTVYLDSWLVDVDGFYSNGLDVIIKLNHLLKEIIEHIEECEDSSYVYHVTTKPRKMYNSIITFCEMFY